MGGGASAADCTRSISEASPCDLQAAFYSLSADNRDKVVQALESFPSPSFDITITRLDGEVLAELDGFSASDSLGKMLEAAATHISDRPIVLLHDTLQLSQALENDTLGSLGIDRNITLTHISKPACDPSKLELQENNWSTLEDCEGAICGYDYKLLYEGKKIRSDHTSEQHAGWSSTILRGRSLHASLSDDKKTLIAKYGDGETKLISVMDLIRQHEHIR